MVLKVQCAEGMAFYRGKSIQVSDPHKFPETQAEWNHLATDYEHIHRGEAGEFATTHFCIALIDPYQGDHYRVRFNLHAWILADGKTVEAFHPAFYGNGSEIHTTVSKAP